MAVNKIINSSTLQIEVENGTDSKGNIVYKKKSFTNIRSDAATQDLYDVAEAIKSVLNVGVRDYYIADSSKLINQQ